jgi:nucleoside-diphosphate-sugar epimerase
MNKAIVTGATGFIGSAFVKYLISHGIEVLALGRKDPVAVSEARWNKLEGAKYLNLHMDSINRLPSHMDAIEWKAGHDCIFFNLAWSGESRLSDLNVVAQLRNVSQSVAALETASKLGCSRFIQIGTMEEAFTQRYLELDHQQHSFYNRHVVYSIAKLAAKQALEVRSSQLGLEFIYVLHSHVMGRDDDKDSFLQMTLLKLIRGDELIFSTGEQYFDVISLEDCALGYYLICQKGIPGKVYWVGSGDPRRLREYVERMYALYPSGREMQFGKLPYNDVILDKEAFSITSLVRDTGYSPTMTFEDTVMALHDHLLPLSSDTLRD